MADSVVMGNVGGFKNAFTKLGEPEKGEAEADKMDVDVPPAGGEGEMVRKVREEAKEEDDDEPWEKWGDYDPKRPTGCHPDCPGWVA